VISEPSKGKETNMNPKTSLLEIQPHDLSLIRTDNRFPEMPLEFFPAGPFLDDMLCNIGPLPPEALFMGQACDDGLPVLLNLHDPAPGPILIVGEHGAGKTALLRALAQSVIATHAPSQIQFAVITNRVEEWQERLADAPHCVGIFFSDSFEAKRLVDSAVTWISKTDRALQSVLLLLDGLEDVCGWENLSALEQVLICGPRKRVWPIATVNSLAAVPEIRLLERFSTRLIAESPGGAEHLNPRFRMKEKGNWLTFQVPSLRF
jgi:hypothetical protein